MSGKGAPRLDVRSLVRTAALALLLAGCPKKEAPPPPAAAPLDAAPSTTALAPFDLDASTEEPFDAWAPERPMITLKPDWENRYNDAPRFVYETLGLPALSPDGTRVVVTGSENDRSADPSLRIITLLMDDREESSATLQSIREYRDAMYPPTIDEPTPETTDPFFRVLIKTVQRRLADANATLSTHKPLRPCRLEPRDDAGIRLHATCLGLSVTYEQHHLRVVGRGGHVRLDRSVAMWKNTTPIPGGGGHEEVQAIYGDAETGALAFKVIIAGARYYATLAPRWHVVRLGP